MKRIILSFVAFLALASIASANPRAVAFRGGGHHGGNFRGAAFNVSARFAFRGPVGFARDAFRGHAFRGIGFRQNFAFRGHQNFYGAAFSQSYFVRQYVAPVYVQPVYAAAAVVAPVYAAPVFAAEVDACVGAAYVQPFAAYSSFGYGLGFGYGGYGHGFRGSPFRRY